MRQDGEKVLAGEEGGKGRIQLAGRRREPLLRLVTPTPCFLLASAGSSVIIFLLRRVGNKTTKDEVSQFFAFVNVRLKFL